MPLKTLEDDPHYNPNADFGQEEITILISCFVEQHHELFLKWLEDNKLSYHNGFRSWFFVNRRRYEGEAMLINAGVEPVGPDAFQKDEAG
ncbi:protein of unknown function [Acidithiobacillus ferrivorans]|uniref:Uncharacterized protein n=1 Tax=Acidithiobacillus ferrivorans TaxID=160808 RepID=A0A060UUJ9_9PROT|nr:hypothetical protein [Acidithiobacillus ferrivorans]CDQ12080.1 hypothetical protein AFERRI_80029 [Acidithiobacillus ferrivorans]SMH64793.1 protein of unknown function [Acidithiobacillus ferrivorans]